MEQLEGAHGDYGARARAALAAAPQPALKDREALMEVIQQALWRCPDTGQMPDDAIADALLARGLRLPGDEYAALRDHHETVAATLRALQAERDAAFAAGQEEMRERAADECGHHLSTFDDVALAEDIEERIRALPINPHP